MLTDFENSFTLDTAINYLRKEYNIFRHLLKTSLYYNVKHKSLKILHLHYHSLLAKLSPPPFKNNFNTQRNILFTYLFNALSSSAYTNHEFTTLRNCWTFGTAFNTVQLVAQLMESAFSRLRTGQRRTF